MLERANKAMWDATVKLQSIRRMVKAIEIRKNLKFNKCAMMIQSLVRRKKASGAYEQRKIYLKKLKQIQKFYHKRYQTKILSSTKIQRWFKRVALKKKSRKIGQCSKFIHKITKVKNFQNTRSSFIKLKKNASAVIIQCKLRQFLGMK